MQKQHKREMVNLNVTSMQRVQSLSDFTRGLVFFEWDGGDLICCIQNIDGGVRWDGYATVIDELGGKRATFNAKDRYSVVRINTGRTPAQAHALLHCGHEQLIISIEHFQNNVFYVDVTRYPCGIL